MNLTFRKTCIAVLAVALSVGAVAQSTSAKQKYISPNNDGAKDVLTIPFKISDKSILKSWSLVIENSKGKVVRTIGNKIALPSTVTLKGIVSQIGKAKEGVEVPPEVTWNGVMDDGQTAPDGEYFYYFVAVDENNNEGKTKKHSVIVDNTKPEVKVTVPEEDIHVFGEGDKADFTIKQSGSKEDLWVATIIDAEGNVVRTMKWENAGPTTFVWNGTDDNGVIVHDGVYKYAITSEDRAGNTANITEVNNIAFSAEKPVTNITINGSKYFSLPSKSKLSKIILDVTIPEPRANSGNKLVNWQVEIINKDKKVVRTYNSKNTNVPKLDQILFDGKDDSGNQIPEGEYQARVTAEYLNGYKPVPVNSPVFVFDATSPNAQITASDKIFSPDGDGNKDTITMTQIVADNKGAPIKNWKGKIVNSEDESLVVAEYDFGEYPPKTVTWTGLDKSGRIALDGKYTYVLTAEDLAGNSFEIKTNDVFQLDTTKTEVMLAKSEDAISPNSDNVQDSITFSPVLKSGTSVANYVFEIKDVAGRVVYSKEGNGALPKSFVWNGKDNANGLCKDGTYVASLEINSVNGSKAVTKTEAFEIDTVAPTATITTPTKVFSPNGDGKKDMFEVYTSHNVPGDHWTGTIIDRKGRIVRVYEWRVPLGSTNKPSITWDGTDSNGNKVEDGSFKVVITSTDKAGNAYKNEVTNITLDTRATNAYVGIKYAGISPISQGNNKAQNFQIRLDVNEGISHWKFNVLSVKGEVVKTLEADNKPAPEQVVWDGLDSKGKSVEGNFIGTFEAVYDKGDEVSASSVVFICSITPPVLSAKIAPEFFSPDNDGTDDDLFIELKGTTSSKLASWTFVINNPNGTESEGKAFWKAQGADKITELLTWNGLSNVSKEKDGKAERVQSAMDYPWVFTVTDDLGMTSTLTGVIPVDILVIRDGNVLKMAVPSIIFRSNAADFKTASEAAGSKVTKEQAQNNKRVLKRVADILKKFPDYTVTVVGHANNTTGKPEEESILVPLSEKRAAYVKDVLISNGIEATRLTAEGKGGQEPVAEFKDTTNWWKNRRVEFLLHK